MRIQKLTQALAAAAVVFATTGSGTVAQEPAPRDMAELLATLREPKLPMLKKQALGRQTYSGTVEVFEVHTTVPSHVGPDRASDVLGLDKPSMRIMVDVRASSPFPMYLAFETTDTERVKKLRKGDKVTLSGKLVKFVSHRDGYDRKPDEWLIFGDVVIAPPK
jgi:hypothetical protein